MKFLENNPYGIALSSACGLVLLISAGLAYVWSMPASSGFVPGEASASDREEDRQVLNDLGPLGEYRIVTERPVCDETRRPAPVIETEESEEFALAAGAPEVALTGVIITPETRLATLRPLSGGDSLVAREGEPLDGDYYGWQVSSIQPRSVSLASTEGDSLEIELQVNTRKIEEPPEPVVAAVDSENNRPGESGEAGGAAANQASNSAAGQEQPLSRAEEIRQRIAERREELRRQAEEEDRPERNTSRSNRGSQSGNSAYQNAIRNMISRNRKENEDDENDGEGSDG
jgi:general secretion pathway protein N